MFTRNKIKIVIEKLFQTFSQVWSIMKPFKKLIRILSDLYFSLVRVIPFFKSKKATGQPTDGFEASHLPP